MDISFLSSKEERVDNSIFFKVQVDSNKSLGDFDILGKDSFIFFCPEKSDENESREVFRRLASVIYKFAMKQKFDFLCVEVENFVVDFLEGFLLSDYKFDKYLSKKPSFKIESLSILSSRSYKSELEKIKVVVNNVNIARDWVNESSEVITPDSFASMTASLFENYDVDVEIFDEKRIQREGLNLIYAVGKGSVNKPRFLVLKYMPVEGEKLFSIVGKGVTFDTGGYYLKPSPAMNEMRGDMAGAVTAVASFRSLVELGVKKNFIVAIPLVENCVSSKAYKPGDIFKSYSGKSVEIKHTDAEGRLILADAISYVDINYKPDLIVDLATLTGALIVALGDNLIGMFSESKEYKLKMFEAGELTSERVWELPVYEEHKELIKSSFADVKNLGADARVAGSIVAAAFLMCFVENSSLIHLDIAGAGLSKKSSFYWPSFGTGKGVRLLVNFFESLE